MVLSFGEVLMDCFPDKNVIGGAPFNVVTHLKRLGENVAIISKIGKDKVGGEILDFLKSEGTDGFIQIDDTLKTGYVTVSLNNGQPSYKIHSGTGWEFLDYVKSNTQPDYFVFGSLCLYFSHNKKSFEQYVKAFPNAIKVCDINLRTPFYNIENIELCLKNSDILKINDEELDYLAKNVFSCSDAIAHLKNNYKIQKIILTKGSKGADLFWDNKHYTVEAGKVNDLKDTVGAGDAFTSQFIYGLLHQIKAEENLKRASDFASKICEQSGAIPKDKSIYLPFKLV